MKQTARAEQPYVCSDAFVAVEGGQRTAFEAGGKGCISNAEEGCVEYD